MSAFLRRPGQGERLTPSFAMGVVPVLGRGVRLSMRPPHGAVLLAPERGYVLNGTALAIVLAIDGESTVADIAAGLAKKYGASETSIRSDVLGLLQELASRRLVVVHGALTTPAGRR